MGMSRYIQSMRLLHIHTSTFISAIVCLPALAAPQSQPSQSLVQVYMQREQAAPTEVTTELANLRQVIKQKNLSFEVAYTKAVDISLDKLAAARLPPPGQLSEIAGKQN